MSCACWWDRTTPGGSAAAATWIAGSVPSYGNCARWSWCASRGAGNGCLTARRRRRRPSRHRLSRPPIAAIIPWSANGGRLNRARRSSFGPTAAAISLACGCRGGPSGDSFVLGFGPEQLVAHIERRGELTYVEVGELQLTLSRTAPTNALSADAEQRFAERIRRRDWPGAVAVGGPILSAGAPVQAVRVAPQLVHAARRIGDQQQVDRAVARIRELHRQQPTEATTAALARCLEVVGAYREGFAITAAWDGGNRQPSAAIAAQHASLASLVLPNAEAMPIVEDAIQRTSAEPLLCAQVWRLWCRLYAGGDASKLARGLFAIWRLAPESELADEVFRKQGHRAAVTQLEAAAQSRGGDAAGSQSVCHPRDEC